jgi:hypothetical protein
MLITVLVGASMGGVLCLCLSLVMGDRRQAENYRRAVIPLVLVTWAVASLA